jgi:hypothetical protein
MPPAIALLLAWLAIVGAVVLSYTFAGNSVLPLPHRYMLEFNVCTVLAIPGLISLAPKFRPLLVAAVLLAGAPGAIHFLRHTWSVEPAPQSPEASAGYPIVQWLKGNGAGSGRIMASGEVEPELSVWSDLPQVGGSGQGVSNPLTFAAQRQIAFGCGAESERIAELWMRALHVEYFIAHGADSQEYFHWIAEPEKFSVLPAVWQSGHGDTIYRARNFDGREAVVVDLDELKRLPQMASTGDIRFLEAYLAWAAGKRPASIHWNAAGSADVDADLGADEGILIKTNYDAGWRVGEAATGSDPIGFLLIRGRQGPRHLRLRFGRSWDGWLGIAITGMTIILVSLRVQGVWIAAAAVLPAGVAWLFLASSVPPTAGLAEQAFMRLQPPMINPQGIVDAATNAQPPFTPGRVIAMYGLKFGGAKDSVVVRAGDRAAEIVYRGENQVNFKMPAGAAGDVPVSVEVNGCRGNSFGVAVR